MDSTKELLRAKARKLYELSLRGIGGEKTNAENKLREFLEKHNLTLDEIDSSINNRLFKVKDEDSKTILINVILSVNPYCKVNSDKKHISANLDTEDFIEVKEKYKYFSKLFSIEKTLLMMAFFSKHEEFFKPDEFALNKFRDSSRNENQDLANAREKAQDLQKQAEEQFKQEAPPKDFSNEQKNMSLERIQRNNLARLHNMVALMLTAKYKKANVTLNAPSNE